MCHNKTKGILRKKQPMKKFKSDLYDGIIYSYGKILSQYDPNSYDILIKEIGKELQEFLAESGYAIEETGTIEEVERVIGLFVENGFASSIEISPGKNADKIIWHDLYGMKAYEKLQDETRNPFLSCPLNAILYNVAGKYGKTLRLYSKHFDHETGITESEEGLVDSAQQETEFKGIPLEEKRLYELANEQRSRLEDSLRHLHEEIAAHKETERKLIEQKDLLNQIIDNLPINLYLKDSESKHVLINKEACRTMGGDKEKIIGKTAVEVFGAELGKKLVEDDKKLFESQTPLSYEDDFLVDGETVRMLGKKIPLRLKDNKEDFLLGYSIDISDRAKKEEQINQAKEEAVLANKAKSNFLATMSHELRTPMNGVLGMAQLLLETDMDEEQKLFCETIVQSGSSLTKILSDVLDLSKIEAGKLGLNPVPVDLSELSREILQLFSGSAKAKQLKLNLNYDMDLSDKLVIDGQLLKQVLSNLLANAIKFTDQGHIEFCLKFVSQNPTHQKIRFEIQDSGIGISEEDQIKIFSPFTQADGSSTRQYEGTGLGLTICQNIIKLMGANLEVKSELGKGSLFFFELELPYIVTNVTVAHTKTKEHIILPQFKNSRVLVVEDDNSNQFLVRSAFNLWGIPFDMVSNGEDAIKIFKKESYSLVLMDILMPGMDGIETTAHLKAMGGEKAKVPIIAFSAKAMDDDKNQVFAAGMDDFISKPVSLSLLKSKLIEWIDAEKGE